MRVAWIWSTLLNSRVNEISVARFGEKMTFLWEFFSYPYVVNGEFLAASLFSTWAILKFLM
jgi:hypothetical protein